jgi:succinate dehydrogenase / fumarate reductase cytochrome b subunit
MIAFFFILAHVLHLHHLGAAVGGGRFDPQHAASSTGQALQAALWIQVFYAVGVLACAYHFGNGLWTQGITWGVWTSPAAQRRAGYVTGAIGAALAVVGLSALGGMTQIDVDQARQIESRMQRARAAAAGQELPADLPPTP